ncbi:hypothetical protein PGT21_014017 [Puccinia graminis f. sp. tritici]|uniref:Uncharacterized protein n=1 Tax=Puccinia graminis f. sp. tritici TaxID=56615 RepID=A0A5B0QDG3_PUCGR|nr:hypothetical protein PGT21_037061 [Puccinia graminis f. sp. tritici]KAA1112879.1 hypothetical protein PGT21_014017 [Puccinia graminis f. sp. tritici]
MPKDHRSSALTSAKSDRYWTRSRMVVLGPRPSIQKKKIGFSSPPSMITCTPL